MQNIQALQTWDVVKQPPIAIAGPCSAETPEQLLETCKQITEQIDISLLRAGIWKPRTRPGSFEGVGEEGLKWFAEVKQELNMPITTEVATAEHVELALRHGVDVLWIGARSTVNPFTVQEIANALKGVKIPVMVKNPINADINLWIGALERFYNAGITQLAAIHRGFSNPGKSKFRNSPMWQIPLSLKVKFPDLPLICDPSHIAGTRELILPVSQKAIDLNYDGLMIETHHTPDAAWSDAKQQITPARLAEILNHIKVRKPSTDDAEFNNQLEELREKIDRVDRELLENLNQRLAYVEQIGEYKRENDITVFQAQRWIEIFQSRPEYAKELGMSKGFTEQLFKLIHDESIKIQERIMNSEPA